MTRRRVCEGHLLDLVKIAGSFEVLSMKQGRDYKE